MKDQENDKKQSQLRSWQTSAIVIMVALLLSYVVYEIRNSLIQSAKKDEHILFERIALLIEDKVHSYIYGLQGMNGVYLISHFQPTPNEVRKYAENRHYFSNFPGSLGFGFIRKVSKKEISTYKKYRQSFDKNFSIKNLKDFDQEYYYIIEVIEPLESNMKAVGLNVASEDRRYQAANKAMMTGSPQITAPVQLVQTEDKTKSAGFLLFLPLYATNTLPLDIKEREEKLVGWSYTPIYAQAIKAYIDSVIDPLLSLSVYDSNEELIFSSNSEIPLNHTDKNLKIKEIDIAGRTWVVYGNVGLNTTINFINIMSLLTLLLIIVLSILTRNKVLKFFNFQDEAKQKRITLENWRHAILESSQFAMIATTETGMITTFNKAAEQLLGYNASEVIGKISPGIFHCPLEVQEYAKILSSELGYEIPANFEAFVAKSRREGFDLREWTYITKDGVRLPVRLSVTVIKDGYDKVIGYLGIAENLSEIRKMQKNILSSAKMSALGEMAGGIAHEINNPLAIIIGRLSLIKKQFEKVLLNNDHKIYEELDKIEQTCLRISTIIKGLKDFSRESSHDSMVETNILEVLTDTLSLCHQQFHHHEIELKLRVDADLVTLARPVQLSQVFMNLLNNSLDAIKYSQIKWIDISAYKNDDKIHIFFTDSGHGIPEAVAAKIMEPFYTTKEIGKGTGLGLSISRGLIQAHHGTLEYVLESRNTQFLIILPGLIVNDET